MHMIRGLCCQIHKRVCRQRRRFDASTRLDSRRRATLATEAGRDRDADGFSGGDCSFPKRSMNQRPAGPGGLSVL
jgi:hypothetical protein